MMNFKQLAFAAAMVVGMSAGAMAAPITGDFSGTGIGAYLDAANVGATATTATKIDFGRNGIGVNGSFSVVDATGSFVAYNTGSMSDLLLASSGNPTTASSVNNPFISFSSGALTLNFGTADVIRTATSITISGTGMFTSGADSANGLFSLAINSNAGSASNTNFTFTTSASAAAVPEPISMSILGAGLVGMGVIRLRRKS